MLFYHSKFLFVIGDGPPPLKRRQIDDPYSEEEQDFLCSKVANLFHACAILFNIIQHPGTVDMFNALAPSFVLPKRKTLGGRLLDETYARTI